MTQATPTTVNAELVPQVSRLLSTRTLSVFAEESRQDGESLQQAVERYDIDYAWHVLCSPRTLDAVVAALEARLTRELTAQQRDEVVSVLKAAAAHQASDLLMSFDNDLASQLALLMMGAWGLATPEQPSVEVA
jgi:uncharacterized lipoprotein YmbA